MCVPQSGTGRDSHCHSLHNGWLGHGYVCVCSLTSSSVYTLLSSSPLSAGSDYIQQTTVITFNDGDLRQCVEIDIIDDEVGENTEFFTVQLESNLPLFRSTATVFILDDGGKNCALGECRL